MAGKQIRISEATVKKIEEERRRQTREGLSKPSDAQALDSLLGIEIDKTAKTIKKKRGSVKPSGPIMDSFIINAFYELAAKPGMAAQDVSLSRKDIYGNIKNKFLTWKWDLVYPAFMKNQVKFEDHISYRLGKLVELNILKRITKEESKDSEINQLNVEVTTGKTVKPFVRGSYRLGMDGKTRQNKPVLTKEEVTQIKSIIDLQPDLKTSIAEFLTQKNSSF